MPASTSGPLPESPNMPTPPLLVLPPLPPLLLPPSEPDPLLLLPLLPLELSKPLSPFLLLLHPHPEATVAVARTTNQAGRWNLMDAPSPRMSEVALLPPCESAERRAWDDGGG